MPASRPGVASLRRRYSADAALLSLARRIAVPSRRVAGAPARETLATVNIVNFARSVANLVRD